MPNGRAGLDCAAAPARSSRRRPARRRTPATGPRPACAARRPRWRRPRRRSARRARRRCTRRLAAAVGRGRAHDRPPIVAPVDPAELAVQATRRPLGEHVLGGDRGAGRLAAALEGARPHERRLPRSLPRVDEAPRPRRRRDRSVAGPQVAVVGGDRDGDQRGGVQRRRRPTRGSGRGALAWRATVRDAPRHGVSPRRRRGQRPGRDPPLLHGGDGLRAGEGAGGAHRRAGRVGQARLLRHRRGRRGRVTRADRVLGAPRRPHGRASTRPSPPASGSSRG